MINIRKIISNDVHLIRISVLRKGKNLISCPFIGDNLSTTTHLGLFIDQKLVGIVSVFKIKHDNFYNSNQFQIRGMAVLDEFQKQGYGALLIKAAEKVIDTSKNALIWLNARELALSFYKKQGYEITGIPFLIENIGIHYTMIKIL